MQYAIQTLEIARIRQAHRVARGISIAARDIDDGMPVDYRGLEHNI